MRLAIATLLLVLLAWPAARGDLPPQPALDLPEHPSNYQPRTPAPGKVPLGGPPVDPIRGDPAPDDPRDEEGPILYGEELDPESSTLVYVIDISGSMRRDARLERAQEELRRSIAGLSPAIRFGLVSYSCTVRAAWPGLRPADAGHKALAIAWVNGLLAYGSTGTGPAVALALSDRSVQSVALLTDGAPNCGADSVEGHRRMIRAANWQGATVTVFGIAASGHYRAFCMNVAADSGGSYYDVP